MKRLEDYDLSLFEIDDWPKLCDLYEECGCADEATVLRYMLSRKRPDADEFKEVIDTADSGLSYAFELNIHVAKSEFFSNVRSAWVHCWQSGIAYLGCMCIAGDTIGCHVNGEAIHFEVLARAVASLEAKRREKAGLKQ